MSRQKLKLAVFIAALTLSLSACGNGNTKVEKNTAAGKDALKTTENEADKSEKSVSELYEMAVKDAVFAEESEIEPLVSLTKEDELVTWDDKGRVLLCTWHSYPDSYPKGETVKLEWGTVWTFTDKEIAKYADELGKSKDAGLRLQQIIGLPPDSDYSTFTGLWVNPDDVHRPANQPDPLIGDMAVDVSEDMDEEFKKWFDENILDSYFYGAYPWTRLGYTYDWADNGKEYGLTEFLIDKDAEAEVAFTETTDEFVARLAEDAE